MCLNESNETFRNSLLADKIINFNHYKWLFIFMGQDMNWKSSLRKWVTLRLVTLYWRVILHQESFSLLLCFWSLWTEKPSTKFAWNWYNILKLKSLKNILQDHFRSHLNNTAKGSVSLPVQIIDNQCSTYE